MKQKTGPMKCNIDRPCMRCAPQEAGAVEDTASGRFYFEDLAQVNDSAATVLESTCALGGSGMPTDCVFMQVTYTLIILAQCRGGKHSCSSVGVAWVLLMHGNWHAAGSQGGQCLSAGRQPSEEPCFYSPCRPSAASGKADVLISHSLHLLIPI